jgi:ATP-binding cassette subfamily C protein
MAYHSIRNGDLVSRAFRTTRGLCFQVSIFSVFVNVLMLTGSLYMMQVYDRVLASRSIPTLVGLSILALAAFALQGWLDHIRLKILGRIGASVDAALSPATLLAAMSPPPGARGEPLQAFRDLATLRAFLSSLGPTALIDFPFTPLFVFVCFMLHPLLGWLCIAGIVLIVGLTLLIERWGAAPTQDANSSGAAQTAVIEAGRRNAEVVRALGMHGTLAERFEQIHSRHVDDSLRITETTGGLSAFAKTFRFVLQSAVLGLGALLVIRGEMSGGAMIAASILTSRALAPVEVAVAHIKGFMAARQAVDRLRVTLPLHEQRLPAVALPPPRQSLKVEDLTVVAPGSQRGVVTGVRFELFAGEALGLVGPSGSGKSSLARALVGVWPTARGRILLDGAPLTQWSPDMLGRAVGYLPQDVDLMPGTVAENISRFDPNAGSDAILKAAHAAGAHAMIVGLPDGYDTVLGEGGAAISGGQRQRIALARALYGDPFLVVLDEPNSSLDADGDAALASAIDGVRARGGIVVVVTHRQSGLSRVNLLGVLANGRMTRFGPQDEVMSDAARETTREPAGEALREPARASARPDPQEAAREAVGEPVTEAVRGAPEAPLTTIAARPALPPEIAALREKARLMRGLPPVRSPLSISETVR